MADENTRPQPMTLAQRLKAAAAQASTAKIQTRKPATDPHTAAAAANPKPRPAAPKAKTPTQHAAKAGQSEIKRKGGNHSRAPNSDRSVRALAVVTDEQRERILAQLRAISTRPDTLWVIEDEIIVAMRATIAGAAIVGPAGHGDRMTLFKLAGLPLHAGANNGGGRAELVGAMRALGGRLERALHGPRHTGVTLDAEEVQESPSNGAFGAHTHKMGDLVRMPDTPAPAAEPVHQVETAAEVPPGMEQADDPSSPAADLPPLGIPAFLRRR